MSIKRSYESLMFGFKRNLQTIPDDDNKEVLAEVVVAHMTIFETFQKAGHSIEDALRMNMELSIAAFGMSTFGSEKSAIQGLMEGVALAAESACVLSDRLVGVTAADMKDETHH